MVWLWYFSLINEHNIKTSFVIILLHFSPVWLPLQEKNACYITKKSLFLLHLYQFLSLLNLTFALVLVIPNFTVQYLKSPACKPHVNSLTSHITEKKARVKIFTHRKTGFGSFTILAVVVAFCHKQKSCSLSSHPIISSSSVSHPLSHLPTHRIVYELEVTIHSWKSHSNERWMEKMSSNFSLFEPPG